MPTNPVRFTENDVRRALRSALKDERDGTIRVLTSPPDHPPGDAIEPAPGAAA